MQPERRCHFPVNAIMKTRISATPPRNSMNSPRGPSIWRNGVMIIVPVRSDQFIIPRHAEQLPRQLAPPEVVFAQAAAGLAGIATPPMSVITK
jgi:hypothetical protein